MNGRIVTYPVHDLDNRLLVAAGTELTPAFLESFLARGRESFPLRNLLEHGTIRQDLLHQFSIPPYDVIFSQADKVAEILAVMSRVRLPLPLLHGLDYFRRHDFHTYRHMLMIFALTTLIAGELGVEHGQMIHEEIAHVGPTHDIGKILVPLPILLKKDPLTLHEYNLLRHHTVNGYLLLAHYLGEASGLAALIARDHHERRDGSGYPTGVEQRDLKIEITTVADIYDALIAQRPYRPVSFDNRSALEVLTWMADNGEIGWEAVQVLVAHNRRAKPPCRECQISMERRGHAPEGNAYGQVVGTDHDD